jgi:protein associated with RNAse G/E
MEYQTISMEEYRRLSKGSKASKLRNKRTLFDGVWYHSKKEAKYAQDLRMLQQAGVVSLIESQVKYPLEVNGLLICRYILDFRVTYADGRVEHIDVKGQKNGVPYALFTLKKKLMHAIYGIQVIEV